MFNTEILQQIKDQISAVENDKKAKGPLSQIAFIMGRILKLVIELDVRLNKQENPRSRLDD